MLRTVLCTVFVLFSAFWTAKAQNTDQQWVYYSEPPVLLYMPPPLYPQIARVQHVEGTVRVQAVVGEDGLVHRARIVHSIPPLDGEARRAVWESQWQPARDEYGKPVAVWVGIPVRFSLTDSRVRSMAVPPPAFSEEAERRYHNGVYTKPIKPLAEKWRFDGADFTDKPPDTMQRVPRPPEDSVGGKK